MSYYLKHFDFSFSNQDPDPGFRILPDLGGLDGWIRVLFSLGLGSPTVWTYIVKTWIIENILIFSTLQKRFFLDFRLSLMVGSGTVSYGWLDTDQVFSCVSGSGRCQSGPARQLVGKVIY